jgi:DNA-binding transcriptional LysR family regulator
MESSLKYFLVVAQELNITRAAQKSNITQQSMSAHIKRLEEELDTKLFFRRPSLRLTYAGEVLLDTLNEIKILEENFIQTIQGDKKSYKGTLIVGMSHARANILVPELMSVFKAKWPNINIILQQDNTHENLDNRIVNGYLDVFVGIADISDNPDIKTIHIRDEKFYLLVSDNLFRRYVKGANSEGLPYDIFVMRALSGVTYVLDKDIELNYKLFERYLTDSGIKMNFVIRCNDSQLRTRLCTRDVGVTVVNDLMLVYAQEYNMRCRDNPIHIIPMGVPDAPSVVKYHRNRLVTPVIREFMSMVIDITNKYYEVTDDILKHKMR